MNIVTYKSLIQLINMYLFAHPVLFFNYMKFRPIYKDLIVSNDTEIVIEGFPRSANTFAVAALEYAQARKLKIARHLHAPAQIIRALDLKIPAMLLIRHPRDAVLSFIIRECEVPISLGLIKYLSFYKSLYSLKNGFLIAPFDDVVNDFGAVIERLNQKFGTAFKGFQHTAQNQEQIFKIVEDMERMYSGNQYNETKVSRPSPIRKQIKKEIETKLKTALNRNLLDKCQVIYNKMLPG